MSVPGDERGHAGGRHHQPRDEERQPGALRQFPTEHAVEDLTREYALLTLVEGSLAAVRGEADTATLQFSDGTTSVLLHVSPTEGGGRRIDGWVDASALAIRLVQGEREWSADPGEHGRFAFEEVLPGVARLRMVVKDSTGELRDFQTPQFEV